MVNILKCKSIDIDKMLVQSDLNFQKTNKIVNHLPTKISTGCVFDDCISSQVQSARYSENARNKRSYKRLKRHRKNGLARFIGIFLKRQFLSCIILHPK